MTGMGRVFAASLVATVAGLGVAGAGGIVDLPTYPILVDHGDWLGGQYSTLDIVLIDVGYDYDVEDGRYNGWCLEDNLLDDPPDGSELTLNDTTDPASFEPPCETYDSVRWNRINYLLNHKTGNVWDVQVAIWVLAETDFQGRHQSPSAQAMIADAEANGAEFVPSPGEIVAVALCSDGISAPSDWGTYQDTIIEVLVPSGGFEGCTPLYWRTPHHWGNWPRDFPAGDSIADVFGISSHHGDSTLLEALQVGAGMEREFLRHATAALLNAANADIDFPYSVDETIARVQAAHDNGSLEGLKNQLRAANQMDCPLGTAVEFVEPEVVD